MSVLFKQRQDLANTLSVGIVQTFTYGACQILTIVFLLRSDSIFGNDKKGPIQYIPKMSFIMT